MASVSLGGVDAIARQYAKQDFNGGLSPYLRSLVYNDHKQRQATETIERKKDMAHTMQMITYLLLSVSLLCYAISFTTNLLTVLPPALFIICSGSLIIYVIILHKENKATSKQSFNPGGN